MVKETAGINLTGSKGKHYQTFPLYHDFVGPLDACLNTRDISLKFHSNLIFLLNFRHIMLLSFDFEDGGHELHVAEFIKFNFFPKFNSRY